MVEVKFVVVVGEQLQAEMVSRGFGASWLRFVVAKSQRADFGWFSCLKCFMLVMEVYRVSV